MSWTNDGRVTGGGHGERREFQDALDAATRIIPDDLVEPCFFTDAARAVLAGILHGLQQSTPRRVSVAVLVQTVVSYEQIARALRATPEGLRIYKQYFGGSSEVLTNLMLVVEDRVLRLLERNPSASR